MLFIWNPSGGLFIDHAVVHAWFTGGSWNRGVIDQLMLLINWRVTMKFIQRVLSLAVLLAFWTGAAIAGSPAVNVKGGGHAVQGYDVMSYWQDGKPMKGSAEFSHEHDGAKWLFASKANRDATP